MAVEERKGRRVFGNASAREAPPFATSYSQEEISEPIVKGGRRRNQRGFASSQVFAHPEQPADEPDPYSAEAARPALSFPSGNDVPSGGIRTDFQPRDSKTPFATLSDLAAPLQASPPPPPDQPPFAILSDLVRGIRLFYFFTEFA
jgi:hypothetical protein